MSLVRRPLSFSMIRPMQRRRRFGEPRIFITSYRNGPITIQIM